jgi:hypothetical protein
MSKEEVGRQTFDESRLVRFSLLVFFPDSFDSQRGGASMEHTMHKVMHRFL